MRLQPRHVHPAVTTPSSRPPSPLWLSSRRLRRSVLSRRACAAAATDPAGNGGGGSGSSTPAPSLSRRGLLQGLSVGGAYALAARAAHATDAGSLEEQLGRRVYEFSLTNGLRFIVSERHAAPVVSCHILADVGAWEEEDGLTGLAHLLEHLAFKGTARIGTKDFRKEAPLLDAMDDVFYSMHEATSGREAARLQQRLAALQAEAAELTVPNAYGALLQREGAVGLNASTSQDSTKYFCSLPANKLELWFALEAERFQAPVFRELYTEKAVVSEERRLRVDGAPLGSWQEAFALASFTNNYRRPVIGFQQDIDRLGRREVQDFFRRHYGPSNLVIAIAGDVKPEQVRRLAEKYFGGWQQPAVVSSASAAAQATGSGVAAAGVVGVAAAAAGANGAWWDGEQLPRPAVPPGGGAELLYKEKARAGPAVMIAFYRPSARSEDSLVLEMVSDTLSGSRSARLYRDLVVGGKALTATAISSYPAEKRPHQFLLYAIPTKGRGLEALDADLCRQLEALAGEGPTPAELRRYKKAARASLLEALVSNSTLAAALAEYQVLTGDWRGVLADLARIEGMGVAQVQGAAARLFQPHNCYRGYVLPGQ